jgi:monoamine oxidase
MSDESTIEKADVIIVGSGIAGLYTAWRLLKDDPSQRIVIIERLNRIGGRLQTDLIEIDENAKELFRPESTARPAIDRNELTVKEEEGGMRFTFQMTELIALIEQLGIDPGQIIDFPMQSQSGGNRVCVRGHSMNKKQIEEGGNAIWKDLYKLAPGERDRSPLALLDSAYLAILEENGHLTRPGQNQLTPEFWQKFRLDYTWRGEALNKWQLWGLLRDMGHSEEALVLLSHVLGFAGPYLSLMSAGEAFQLLEDFPENPRFHTFVDGFSTLTQAVYEEVVDMGAEVHLSTNVDRFVREGDEFKVEMTQAPEGKNSSPFVVGGRPLIARSPKLVLAIARRALEKVFTLSPVLNQAPNAREVWAALQTATEQQLLKINIYFRTPWWLDGDLTGQTPVEFGPNFTDLPANAIYPFYTTDITGTDPVAMRKRLRRPAALTIYCDWDNANFWHGLQNVGPRFESDLQTVQNNQKDQTIFPASVAVVEEAMRQFREVFSFPKIPRPIMTSFRLWNGEADFGFAVHQWRINANDREVIPFLAHPVEGVYTCNEAFSDMQGWVQGSLRSADVMLEHFQIDPLPLPTMTAPS